MSMFTVPVRANVLSVAPLLSIEGLKELVRHIKKVEAQTKDIKDLPQGCHMFFTYFIETHTLVFNRDSVSQLQAILTERSRFTPYTPTGTYKEIESLACPLMVAMNSQLKDLDSLFLDGLDSQFPNHAVLSDCEGHLYQVPLTELEPVPDLTGALKTEINEVPVSSVIVSDGKTLWHRSRINGSTNCYIELGTKTAYIYSAE